jgi:hypothetical protein
VPGPVFGRTAANVIDAARFMPPVIVPESSGTITWTHGREILDEKDT